MDQDKMKTGIPFDKNRHGTLEKLDNGSVSVTSERRLKHSIDKVWRAITDPGELENGFPEVKLSNV
jgi:hypothetical protein